MMYYVFQVIAFQAFFLLVYDLFLKKETFFNWNRVYLIGTAILSVILPLVKIERFEDVISKENIINLPAVVIGELEQNSVSISLTEPFTENTIPYYTFIFYLGLFCSIVLFLYKSYSLFSLISRNEKKSLKNFVLIELKNSKASFSFFKYVFLGELVRNDEREAILKHESVHVKQFHSMDLLFFEIFRMFLWFNPLVYMYQKRIGTLHEFIADSKSVKGANKLEYYQNLLSQIFETKHISFINPFFKQSLIKKRIVMLQKSKSKQINLLKYVLLIPMIIGMLFYSSCGTQKKKIEKKEMPLVQQINQLKNAIESREEIKSEEEKQAMISLSKTLNKTRYKNAEDIPFSEVDQVPVFYGCEGLTESETKKCLVKNITMFVNQNFDTKIANRLGLKGKQRVNVIFKISKEGNVVDARARGPHDILVKEAIRTVTSIPTLKPGIEKGEPVNVLYSLPIIFQVAD